MSQTLWNLQVSVCIPLSICLSDMYRLSHLNSSFFSIFGCRRFFDRLKFVILQRSWIWVRWDPPCHPMDAVAPYIQQSTPIGSSDGIWWVLAAFLVLFWHTAVTIRPWSFVFIENIPFSPTFASLFRLQLCSIFVVDCWKVRAVLLSVLIDALLVLFQFTGVFFARKNGALQKSCFRYKVGYNSMPSHHTSNNQPV
jgi:hypothetical protein